MPDFINIGEETFKLAATLVHEKPEAMAKELTERGTTWLEQSGYLSEGLSSLSWRLSSQARNALPVIERLLGAAGEDGFGSLIIGEPLPIHWQDPFTVVYEPHRNIVINHDGSFRIQSPTPSGQNLRSQFFSREGTAAEPGYIAGALHHYPEIKFPGKPMPFLTTVQTGLDSRQLTVGTNWQNGRANFTSSPRLIDGIKASQAVEVSPETVRNLLTRQIQTPQGQGRLIGFDKAAGEVIVSFRNEARPGINWLRSDTNVKGWDGLYPIVLSGRNSPTISAYRNAVGQIFRARETESGLRLERADDTFAFQPSEIGITSNARKESLAGVLGLRSSVGVRAQGGYATALSGRIPISIPGK